MTTPRRRIATAAGLGLALALAVVLDAAPARADDRAALLARAQAAIDDIDYQAARKLATQALDGGGLAAAQLHLALRLAGESAAALGDGAAARAHFVRWILLDPAAALPAGSSPKLMQPFADARAEADRLGRFAVDVEIGRGQDRLEIVLSAHDPLGLVAGMRLRLGDASEVGVTGTRAVLPAADAARVAVAIAVVDARGNELARRTVAGTAGGGDALPGAAGPGEGASAITATAPPRRRWPAIVRWPVWTGVAVVAAGAGGFFAWQVGQSEDELAALNAAADQHSFDDALAIRDRGRRQALFANLGFGVAGAAALAAVLTFTLEPRATVEVRPAPGGATVGATLRF